MTDLIDRLKAVHTNRAICAEAATEIELLRRVIADARNLIVERGESTDVPLQFRQHRFLTTCNELGILDEFMVEAAALRAADNSSQPSDDSALTPGEEWWMDVAGVPVKLDEWQPGAKKRKAGHVPATDSAPDTHTQPCKHRQ